MTNRLYCLQHLRDAPFSAFSTFTLGLILASFQNEEKFP